MLQPTSSVKKIRRFQVNKIRQLSYNPFLTCVFLPTEASCWGIRFIVTFAVNTHQFLIDPLISQIQFSKTNNPLAIVIGVDILTACTS